MTQPTDNPPDDKAPESNHADSPAARAPWFHTYKPAASAKWHLLLAAAMWSTVGIFLSRMGARWLVQADAAILWPIVAVVIGSLKARFVLRRSARRIIGRIRDRGDGRCLGGFISWKSWFLVAVMMTAGRFLRTSDLRLTVRGTAYLAIGSALFLSSLFFWGAWRQQRHPAE